MKSPVWAALFDWDGVIIDSGSAHKRSWERLAEEAGLPLPEDHFLRGFGMRNEAIIPDLLHWTQDPERIRALSLRKEALYRDIVREEGVTVLPGVEPYLQSLVDARIPRVVGSSTHRDNILLILDVTGLSRYFSLLVTSEDVRRGKPDPEVFLKAAVLAATAPVRCVVFEDAHHGIEAAKAAGMGAVGVLTTHPGGKLLGADRLVTRLDELPLDGRPPLDPFPLPQVSPKDS
jgi:HAD superfamily hydrolase (TIGR01509 family)